MKRIFFLGGGLLFILFTIVACSEVMQGEEANENKQKELTPERIGELHNVFLQRAIEEYLPTMVRSEITRTGEEIDVWNISGLIDFFACQPEISLAMEEAVLEEIKELFLGFTPDGTRQYTQEDFLEYLNERLSELYGVDAKDILYGGSFVSTRNSVDSELLNDVRQNALSVYDASCRFWDGYHMVKSRENGSIKLSSVGSLPETRVNVSLVDMAGSAWGTFFGGIGSLIAGGAASAIAEAIEKNKGTNPPDADVPFWQCNPKWI